MLRDMFKKTYTLIDTKYKKNTEDKTEPDTTGLHTAVSDGMDADGSEPNIPQGLWRKCNKCGRPIYTEDVKNNFYVCPRCKGYFRVHAYRRIEMILDEGTFEEWDKEMEFANPLDFPGYEKKIAAAKDKTKLNEAIVTGSGRIYGQKTAIGVCDSRFLMSSMGHNVGEKITRAVERATAERLPIIIFAASGGARMQEGLVSLMQMAKTSAALKRHHEAGLLFISVLTDPTTGGVTASFAMLGDIILAEPGALIGFAGPRVIEQTIHQKLPEGFQRAEFLLEHGFIDHIAERRDQKNLLARILKMHTAGKTWQQAENQNQQAENQNLQPEKRKDNVCPGEREQRISEEIASRQKDAWSTVLTSRSAERPVASDYIRILFDGFTEMHGDRLFGDDGAVIGGIALFYGMPVTVIGQEKGKTTKDNLKCNFGMPSPEGYRKALRLMKQAEKFNRPIICLVDTPGAFCGLEAEERGQGEAIARNLFEMSDLKVPILTIVIGEGGSGGALALAVANEVWMMENSVYSILSPEGFASILWKDSKKAGEAAKVMKMTAKDLYDLKLIERMIPEEQPASKENVEQIGEVIDCHMREFFQSCHTMTIEEIVNQRYDRFRRM
ncbi:MAG: acetyl-CoA carboxylase, carboxyltransferase subunit beta [Clostridium sp.]